MTLYELTDCFTTGAVLSALAYFSEDYLTSHPIEAGTLDQLVLSDLQPGAQSPYHVDRITDVSELADGRVSAIVRVRGDCEASTPEPTCLSLIVFTEQGEAWYVDEQVRTVWDEDRRTMVPLSEGLGTPVATP